MKNLFIAALLSFTVAASAFAATPKEVSAAILSNFTGEFKKASDVSWSVTNDYTKAEFTIDNARTEAYYNAKGDIIATSKNITLDELPLKAKRSFARKFAGYNVKEAIRFEGFDEVAYYISGENEKEAVILKVNENDEVSVFTKARK